MWFLTAILGVAFMMLVAIMFSFADNRKVAVAVGENLRGAGEVTVGLVDLHESLKSLERAQARTRRVQKETLESHVRIAAETEQMAENLKAQTELEQQVIRDRIEVLKGQNAKLEEILGNKEEVERRLKEDPHALLSEVEEALGNKPKKAVKMRLPKRPENS